MRIEKTVVSTEIRDVKKWEGYYVDVTNIDNPNHAESSENPLDDGELAYHLPYNWRDVAESGDLHAKLEEYLEGVEGGEEALKNEDMEKIQELLEEHTDKRLWFVHVYTHSGSTFRLSDEVTKGYLLVSNGLKIEFIELLLNMYTDYFNGHVYEFKAYETLEDAINEEDETWLEVYGHNFIDFEKKLKDIR